MTHADRAIRSICVAGAGIVGLSAALAFARALPGVTVTILEIPADPAALADRLPSTLPTVHPFHAAIGIDELDLVRGGVANHRLGSRFASWPETRPDWLHVFGDHGVPADGIAFHLIWLRLAAAGRALPFHRYAPAGALASVGKFVHPSDDPSSPLSDFLYGLRLEPEAYCRRLAERAAGLARVQATAWGVERRPDGGIAALLVENGRRIEADLFVDCTGPSAALLSQVGGRFEDWSRWLPVAQIGFSEAPPRPAHPLDVVTANADGWLAEYTLPGRTLRLSAQGAACGKADARAVAVRPGRRPKPWIRNVLALGDAAVSLDPLHGVQLHLAHAMILRAIELLPGRDCHPLELREYVRRTEQEALRILDFTALPYLRSGRTEPFWAELAKRELPVGLALTLEQFERRGRLPFFEEETFDSHAWAALLLGLGVTPNDMDPVACGIPLARAADGAAAFTARLEAVVQRFPTYPQLLERMRAAPRH